MIMWQLCQVQGTTWNIDIIEIVTVINGFVWAQTINEPSII